jgi:hypothetical protein
MTAKSNDFMNFLDISKPKKSKSLAISFVNNSLSPHAFTSVCSRFAYDLEKTGNCDAYKLMNSGYRKLSRIACRVESDKDAFELIADAYGSVPAFFHLLEAQRLELEDYARSCMATGKYIQGIFLLFIAKTAKKYGTGFREEYMTVLSVSNGTQYHRGILPFED